MNNVLVLILHYGSELDTCNCLQSIIGIEDIDIVVIDNDPKQIFEIKHIYKQKTCVFRTGGKSGFSESFNMAVRKKRNMHHEYIMILNNDMIVEKDALKELLDTFKENNVGAVGPCMPYSNNRSVVWACGGSIDKILLRIYGLQPKITKKSYDVDYLPGAAILTLFTVWDIVGGMPEKYFLAYEEAEFALRVKKLNVRVLVNPNSIIRHKVGMSSDTQPMYIYNGIRNRIKFGSFLYGKLVGTLLGIIVTLDQIKSFDYIVLWFRAVKDEMRGLSLSRDVLMEVKNQYSSFC
jgi:GT2 family glycosyltransferase